MSKLTYTVTPKGISMVMDNRMRVVPVNSINYNVLRDAIKSYSQALQSGAAASALAAIVDQIRGYVDIPSFIAKSTFNRVQIGLGSSGSYQVRFDGVDVNSTIAERIIDLVTEGFDVEPLARFLDRLMDNPSETARNELYLFIESGNLVITPDGHFLAFKKVRDNYMDIHSGTFNNSVGNVCQMRREDVDSVRDNTCSRGLHFCSYSYLPHFGNGPGNKVMIVKIDPADVVSIPSDYANAKGRTWRYVVVGEVPANEDASTFFKNTMVTSEYDANDPTFVDSDPEDDDDGDSDENLELAFTASDGRTFLASTILEAVDVHGGQRAAANVLGVPRTTLQGWLSRIND
jgi:hypothetical protein